MTELPNMSRQRSKNQPIPRTTAKETKIAGGERALQKTNATTAVQKATTETEAIVAVTKMVAEATGINNLAVGAVMVEQLRQCSFPNDHDGTEVAVELIREMKPKSLIEAHLAIQMLAVHNAALTWLAKATSPVLPFTGSDAILARATELMGLYREMCE